MFLVKRIATIGVASALLFLVSACAGTAPAPAPSVAPAAGNIQTIAEGLQGALANVPNLPPAVTTALQDLATKAAALQAATTPAERQAVVQAVETEVNVIVAVAAKLPLPGAAGPALQAAQVLLPVIEAAVNQLVATPAAVTAAPAAAAAPAAMPPATATLILKADAVKKGSLHDLSKIAR